jgi:tyrosyl-tRNA synthetase
MSDLGLQTLLHGCQHVYTPEELRQRLEAAARERRPLRVKLGMDPTAPDIHLGHVVVLQKMRQFQELGHIAVLIIGDFTAKIGDPTGRSKTRPVLTDEEIRRNAQTYLDQAGVILDTSPEKLELRYNSEWLACMGFVDVLRLAGRMTVQQMLKREDFRARHESETPIGVHEFLYPLMQGWDSVNIRADVELGGTDQTYNNLVGRELQADAGQPPQIVMIMPILRGTDGRRKMSKSLSNTIGVTDAPTDLFGKTMRIPDDLLDEWFALLTETPEQETCQAIAQDPMRAKAMLARRIGARLHGEAAMLEAEKYWFERFSQRRAGEALAVRVDPEMLEDGKIPAWKLAWLAHEQSISRSQARRMVQGGAFEYDGTKITDANALLPVADGAEFRAGRHRKGPRVKQPLIARIELGRQR